MAHKKAGSSSKNGRDSVGQRLGVKVGDGQVVPAGSIIVRQRGMTFLAGTGTGLGHDYTVFATISGRVRFEHATKNKKRVRVEAPDAAVVVAAAEIPAVQSKTRAPQAPKATTVPAATRASAAAADA
jgi:large subunit ribosomal protein L27